MFPVLFAVLNAIVLFAAMLSDGMGDVVSWLALSALIRAVLRFRRSGRPRPRLVR